MSQEVIEKQNDLIVIDKLNLPAIFSGVQSDLIIEEIEKKARSYILDVSTEKGRKDIASLSFKIAKSKNMLDKAGKELTQEAKDKCRKIDKERSRIWDRLESLQHEIRKPLTEFEEKEKSRIFNHESNLRVFNDILDFCKTDEGLIKEIHGETIFSQKFELIEKLKSIEWEEFKDRANSICFQCEKSLREKLEKYKKYCAEKEELDRLRKQEHERLKKEHEENIAKKAAEKARQEAEITAKKREEEMAEKFRKEKEAVELSLKKEREELEKQAAEKLERESDEYHKKKIEDEVFLSIVNQKIALTHSECLLIFESIREGKIPHVKIIY
jgi:colicin import membrane protein